MRTTSVVVLSLVILGAVGCAGTDARCATLCVDDGVGDTCNADSISSCLSSCEARISGAASLCATCLLEEARFSAGPTSVPFCESDAACPGSALCEGEVCSYCADDDAERARCNPPEEVSCSVTYRDSSECAAVCVAE